MRIINNLNYMGKELKLGLPYMGSKRKLSKRIVDRILQDNPDCKYVYDLFGGGGAISFELLQRPQIKKVIYNELNTGITELLKDIQQNGITEKYYQWIDRQTFNENKDKDDWFGGFCKCLWSFGNSQKAYLFGKEIEPIKKVATELIVNKDINKIEELYTLIGLRIPEDVLNLETIQERRLFVSNFIKKNKAISATTPLQYVENISRVQQLERLEQLEIQNKSYSDVTMETPIEETIIYLDPPYLNTAKYAEDVNQQELSEYIKKSPYKIYLSSYDCGLKVVEEFKHNSSLANGKNNQVIEKLFIHEPGDKEEYLKEFKNTNKKTTNKKHICPVCQVYTDENGNCKFCDKM